jgi:CHASE3 domain sensor protein
VLISEASYWRSADPGALGEIGVARTDIQNCCASMIDAETGQRGYLLTGRKEYLQPYDEASQDIRRRCSSLKRLLRPEPAFRRLMQWRSWQTRWRKRKLSELNRDDALRAEGKEDAWRNP